MHKWKYASMETVQTNLSCIVHTSGKKSYSTLKMKYLCKQDPKSQGRNCNFSTQPSESTIAITCAVEG